MPTRQACTQEIESLHEFFVRWFRGETDSEEATRLEDALAPSFEMISPDGQRYDRETIISSIRDSFDSRGAEFDIEIRNVVPVEIRDDRALVRYEEWQETADGTTGRLSTAYFAPARDSTDDRIVEWRYLHETWIES
jgi:hypothetical protein